MGQKADLVVLSANIWTGNPQQPQAQAMALSGDSIIALGSNEEISALITDSTRIIEAQDRMLLPGFIDSHVHFMEGGFRLASVQLRDAATPEEFSKRIADFAKTVPPGTWITGGDWDHERWGGELPNRIWIDSLTPEHPVFVSRLDGHMALANSLALQLAGVTTQTPDVEGGTIVRDKNGALTGVLKDNAMDLIWPHVPNPTEEDRERALKAAMNYVASHGVTAVHHMGSWDQLHFFRRAQEKGLLKTRIYASVPLLGWQRLEQFVAENGSGDEWLHWGGLKGFMDGSLGSQTAAFFDAYRGKPDNTGLFVNDTTNMRDWIMAGDRAGLQPVIHAIGDRAIHILLDIFEQVQQENPPRDRRMRIEHAQHVGSADSGRFGELGVIASVQPYHAIDDGRWAGKILSDKQLEGSFAWKSLLDGGAKLAFGSDWFVAPPIPLETIYAAVTRRTLDDKNPGGWLPQQKISVEQALQAHTINAAYAARDEDRLGSLEKGKLADFVMLDQNLFEIAPETIRDVNVLMTVVGGEIVFERE